MEILANIFGKLDYTAYIIIELIIGIFIIAFFAMLCIRSSYDRLRNELGKLSSRKEARAKSDFLQNIIIEYKIVSVASGAEINTQALIEKHFFTKLRGTSLGERFVKHSVSLMIVLGLLGTFYGLTLSVGRLVEMLTQSGSREMLSNMDSIIMSLISSVKGMSVAFITSLAGIAGSILITIFSIIADIDGLKQSVMVQLEEYLDNIVEPELAKEKDTELKKMCRVVTTAFDEFGNRIDGILKMTLSDFGDRLAAATGSIETSSKCLESTINKFDETLDNFSKNTRDFSEFNYNLRSNIERMDVSFVNLRESLSDATKIIESNQRSINEFSNAILSAAAALGDKDN